MRIAPTLFASFLLASTSLAHAVTAASVCPAPQPASNMTMTRDDEFFQGQALSSDWTKLSGNPIGNAALEAEVYDPAQVTTINQRGLRFSMDTGSGNSARPYKSGGVSTIGKWSQLYGHFEFSARLPQFNGGWPAGWMMPADGSGPPEIDILEFIYAQQGKTPAADQAHYASSGYQASDLATTMHWGANYGADHHQSSPMNNDPLNIDVPISFQDWKTKGNPQGYHTYGIDWRPGSLVWLIDGSVVFCSLDNANTGTRVSSKAMYPILNFASFAGTSSNPGWGGWVTASDLEQTMDIANFRAFKFNDLQ